jgi:hypothetical protein
MASNMDRQENADMRRAERPEAGNRPECGICKDSFSEEEQVELSPCGHDQFCISCIHEWTKLNHTCPVCRAEIKLLIIGAGYESEDETGVRDSAWVVAKLLEAGLIGFLGYNVVIKAFEIFGPTTL